jgi:hypothetical protein
MTRRRDRDGARTLHATLLNKRAVLTFSEAEALCGRKPLQSAVRVGSVARLLPGVYAAAELVEDFLVRCQALVEWSAPRGFVTGLAAAHVWGVIDAPPAVITVQVPPAWHLRSPRWARLLRVATPLERLFRVRGVRVANVPDAVVQAWREARPDVGVSTVLAAVHRNKASVPELLEAVARRKQLPRRGQLLELLGLVGNGVTSYLEYVARRDVFPPRLFPWLQWQVQVWPNGGKRVMDAFDPEALIDLEFDGFGTHGGPEGFERDRERDNDIRSLGYEPVHFTFRDLTEHPERCQRRYKQIRDVRLRQLGPRRKPGLPAA